MKTGVAVEVGVAAISAQRRPMSLATPANDDMSLASPDQPVAARHVSEPLDTPKEPRETEAVGDEVAKKQD